jgi:hypothetical protein
MNANPAGTAPPAANMAFICDLTTRRDTDEPTRPMLETIQAQIQHAEDRVDLLEDLPKY